MTGVTPYFTVIFHLVAKQILLLAAAIELAEVHGTVLIGGVRLLLVVRLRSGEVQLRDLHVLGRELFDWVG